MQFKLQTSQNETQNSLFWGLRLIEFALKLDIKIRL